MTPVDSIESAVELCSRVAAANAALRTSPLSAPAVTCAEILIALSQFMECVRYLNTRRSRGAVLDLVDEAAVQDAVFLMLRPWITDLVSESPADKAANRFVIKDFSSRQARTVIEVKFIRDANHGKVISKELHDDIEMYRSHPHCEDLIFFLYDPDAVIPDVDALKCQIEVSRRYGDRALACHLVVVPR